ncbi:pentatricopeptide repeat-containing protein At4g21300-like [Actinidia eriantha]|uniref:pentatricopeptide repeat-containing protein At4g21300-like n=1 Tax=Actinidia eriantha TaxID=165200 RepID=UPI002587E346|nr:pentatricopeptide repeat-containing protein At4g21300-like [Actinidia eriantha]XP_057488862.1 pentatricopeptide repeat-containing protein At4g21300-like [Actinidia eriantha]
MEAMKEWVIVQSSSNRNYAASEGVLVSPWRPGLHSSILEWDDWRMCEAFDLFHEMISSGVKPDSITFASILPSISKFKYRDVEIAHNLFIQRSAIYIVICTAMISGYVLNGMSFNALDVFRWLLLQRTRSNAVTLASVLPSGACLAALRLDKELHGYIVKNGLEGSCFLGSAISDIYMRNVEDWILFIKSSHECRKMMLFVGIQ